MIGDDHNWLTICNRRWCMGCEIWQYRKSEQAEWRPRISQDCERSSPFAKEEYETQTFPNGNLSEICIQTSDNLPERDKEAA